MACISRLGAGFQYDCEAGDVGLISAIIINKEDIATMSLTNGMIKLSLQTGKTPYLIDTVKRSLVLTSDLKVNEGAPNAFTHTATLNITAYKTTGASASQSKFQELIIQGLSNKNFIIIARKFSDTTEQCRVYGAWYGLYATSITNSSHDNGGFTTAVLATPDTVLGEDNLVMSYLEYSTLYALATY